MACRLQNFDSDLLIGDVLLELADVILGFGQIEVFRFILHFSYTPIMSSRDDADLFEQITILSRPHNEHRLDVPLKGGSVRKRSYDPLNLVLAGNRKARGKTTAAIGIPPTSQQDVSHSVHHIHDSHLCHACSGKDTFLTSEHRVTFS